MKSILISIKPKWVVKILNGEKTIEIRKTAPKDWVDYLSGKTKIKPEPSLVYIYCTKGKPYLTYEKHVQEYILCDTIEELGKHGNVASPTDNLCALQDWGVATNGHIVAKFTLREVEKFDFISEQKYKDNTLKYNEEIRKHIRICKEACMSAANVVLYLDTKCLGINNSSGMIGYAWHISDLQIFYEPRELSDLGLKRAPQSWCYVEEIKQ